MLQICVKNNIRIRGASTRLKAAVTAALTKENTAYTEAIRRRRPTWGIEPKHKLYIMDLGDIVAPRGFLNELKEILKQQGYDPAKVITNMQEEGYTVNFGPWNPSYAIRAYQQPFIEALVKDNGVGIAPAGSGKTIMGCKAIHDIGKPTLWLTHTTDLMYQTKDRAEATLQGVGEIGLLGDGVQKWGSGKLIIATVQTLQANPQYIEILNPLIGLVVIDEAHHFPALMFIEVAGQFNAARILGLTATPDRKDHLEAYMYAGVGPQLYEIDRSHLYDNGSLLKPEIKFVFTQFDYEQASIREGDSVDAGGEDLNYTELTAKLIEDPARRTLIAENILENMDRGTGIVLTESVRYCFNLKDEVERLAKEKGVKVPRMAVVHGGLSRYTWRVASGKVQAVDMVERGEAVDYKYSDRDRRWQVKIEQYTEDEMKAWQVTKTQRKELLDAVRRKEYDVLFATQLAREGLDIDHLTVEHMAMPKRGDSSSKNNGSSVEQEVGRIQRPDPSNPNKQPLLIDYVDYNVGVFQSQYYSRRKVYTRLGLKVPGKSKTPKEVERDMIDSWLSDLPL